MVYVKKKLPTLSHDDIQAYMLDPANNPLPEHQKEQFDRVLSAARLMDDYPDESMLMKMLQHKYKVGMTTLKKDVDLAREVYKTKHTFDWDFWHIWQIRDQLELIKQCKAEGNLREWNNAKKVLHSIIGEKPEGVEDPNRMGKNQFFIQVNIGGEIGYKPIDEVHQLRPNEVKEIVEIMQQPIDEAQAVEIMDS